MSSIPDMDLDLENLFQPAWAQGKAEANRYEKFTGDEGAKPERRRGDRRERSRNESFGEQRGPLRRDPGQNSATAKGALTAVMTGENANVPNRSRRCRKSPLPFCRTRRASNRWRVRLR